MTTQTTPTYGIPTTYNGIRFRSRLEARWAITFDRLQWPWAYEPIDCDGWIPDFIIRWHKPLAVEIKPAFTLDEMQPHTNRIDKSSWEHEAIILGAVAYLNVDNLMTTEPIIGLHRDHAWITTREQKPAWAPAATTWCRGCASPAIYNTIYSYECRRCGAHDGDNHLNGTRTVVDAITDYWTAAGNTTQWNP